MVSASAFSNCANLTLVSLPSSVTSIESSAFANCPRLIPMAMPSKLTKLADGVFANCTSLTTMSIPSKVTAIGNNAFSGCSSLSSVSIPSGVTTIGSAAFKDCSALASISLPSKLKKVESETFVNCRALTKVELPSALESVANGSFAGCEKLVSISIPPCVSSISEVFPYRPGKLTNITLVGNWTSIGASLFVGCSAIPALEIPASVTTINAAAFNDCVSLVDVSIPPCVKSIFFTFPTTYSKITRVVLVGKRTTIESTLFVNCTSLESVTIPKTVTNIDNNAFATCGKIYDVNAPLKICNTLQSVFAQSYNGITSVTISAEDVAAQAKVEGGYKFVGTWLVGYTDEAEAEIPNVNTLTGITRGALENCRALARFNCSSTSKLVFISDAAFKGCTELEEVTLPKGLKNIGNEAFMGCSRVEDLLIPGTVECVGDRAFYRCSSLHHAQIASGVRSLGEEAFYSCWKIDEVDIPDTVTSVGKDAFGGDSRIIRAGMRGDIRPIHEVFSDFAWIREFTVKEGDKELVEGLFSGCKSLNAVVIRGNCPKLANDGRNLYQNTNYPFYNEEPGLPDLSGSMMNVVTYVEFGTTGWDGTTYSIALPMAWPLVGDFRRPIAYWDRPSYLCRFHSNGGTLDIQDTYQYSEENFRLPPTPVQSGYVFDGWWTKPEGGLAVTEETIFIEGVYQQVWAHWVKGHRVYLDANGGTVIDTELTYLPQSTYGVLPTPMKSGYIFKGWLDKGHVVLPETKVDASQETVLVAQWQAVQYNVRYNPNGGTGKMPDSTFTYGAIGNLRGNTFKRNGYVFKGWAKTSTATSATYKDREPVKNLALKNRAAVTLYAVWEKDNPLTYTIQFIKNDGAGTVTNVVFKWNEKTTLPKLSQLKWVRRGMFLKGWATSSANASAGKIWKLDGGIIAKPTDPGKKMDAIAVWGLQQGYYSVKFMKNDGTGKWRGAAYKYGDKTTLPSCASGLSWSRSGYTFKGWSLTPNGAIWKGDRGTLTTEIPAGTENMMLYAIWQANSTAKSMSVMTASLPIDYSSAPTPEPVKRLSYYYGFLADQSLIYDLIVDKPQTDMSTGFVRIESSSGVLSGDCECLWVDDGWAVYLKGETRSRIIVR